MTTEKQKACPKNWHQHNVNFFFFFLFLFFPRMTRTEFQKTANIKVSFLNVSLQHMCVYEWIWKEIKQQIEKKIIDSESRVQHAGAVSFQHVFINFKERRRLIANLDLIIKVKCVKKVEKETTHSSCLWIKWKSNLCKDKKCTSKQLKSVKVWSINVQFCWMPSRVNDAFISAAFTKCRIMKCLHGC